MKLFLGVDGGQSSTVALIADEKGRVLGAGQGGPCNHVAASEGRAKFAQAIHQSLAGACNQAGLEAGTIEFEAACLGFSGGIADKEAYTQEFIRSRIFKITHDAEIALSGATAGSPGIIVIAGTGSIAFGKNNNGKVARAGGWGYIFGDEGGAFDIVRQALRAALAMEEGWGNPTSLRGSLLHKTGAVSANDLMHSWYNNFDRQRAAELAPLIDEAVQAGDVVARNILTRAGRDLSDLVVNVFGVLFQPGETVPVRYIGGAFESKVLTIAMKRSIFKNLGCDAQRPLLPPAAGALLEALRLTGNLAQLSQIPFIKS